MESLLHYEALRGKVQMIYVDPPYGIKYDSNFQQQIDSTRNDEKIRRTTCSRSRRFGTRGGLGSTRICLIRQSGFTSVVNYSQTPGLFSFRSTIRTYIRPHSSRRVFRQKNAFVTLVVKKKNTTTVTDPVNDYVLWYGKNREAARLKVKALYEKRGRPEDDSKFNTLISNTGEMKRVKDLTEETRHD